jgi:membrane-bound lytic murein transglycosylase A
LPDPRPSEKIAKLFPQVDPKNAGGATEPAKSTTPVAAQPATTAAQTSTTPATAVPLPEARPNIQPSATGRRYRQHYYHYRYRRYR